MVDCKSVLVLRLEKVIVNFNTNTLKLTPTNMYNIRCDFRQKIHRVNREQRLN